MFEYLATFTVCRLLSKYCHGGKILLKFYYDMRSGIVIKGGLGIMSENEIRLLNMVYESDDPEFVIEAAIKVFCAFLEKPQEHPEQILADLLESV